MKENNEADKEEASTGVVLERIVMRIGDYEMRSCGQDLTTAKPHVRAEIIKWHTGGETCHTIACWAKDKEGFYIEFVGRRPLDDCEPEVFWKLAKVGQDHLDEYFDELHA